MKLVQLLAAVAALGMTTTAFANNCEVTKDGKTAKVTVADEAACKAQGGKFEHADAHAEGHKEAKAHGKTEHKK